MIIEGFFKPSHALRTCLEHEYAFEVAYKKYVIRVGHTKGVWTCAKMLDDKVVDQIDINDCFGGSTGENDLTKALYTSIEERHREKADAVGIRRYEARCIEDFFNIWGGRADDMGRILVVQPGRNAWVDGKGEFVLSARVNEFKS